MTQGVPKAGQCRSDILRITTPWENGQSRFLVFVFYLFVVLQIEPWVSCMVCKLSVTELCPQPLYYVIF